MPSEIFKVENVEHLNFIAHGLLAASLLNAGIRTGLFDLRASMGSSGDSEARAAVEIAGKEALP